MKKSIMNILHIFILSFALMLSAGCSQEEEILELSEDRVLSETACNTQDGTDTSGDEGRDSEKTTVTVYICGAVNCPGVYTLDEGARIKDAIDASLGMSDEADREYINQAMLLTDGEKVYIPTDLVALIFLV